MPGLACYRGIILGCIYWESMLDEQLALSKKKSAKKSANVYNLVLCLSSIYRVSFALKELK